MNIASGLMMLRKAVFISRSRLRKNRLEPHKKTEHLRLGFLVFGLEHNFK